MIQAIINALAQLPQRVVWKWEEKSLPESPKNIYISNWLPQNDILGKIFEFLRKIRFCRVEKVCVCHVCYLSKALSKGFILGMCKKYLFMYQKIKENK